MGKKDAERTRDGDSRIMREEAMILLRGRLVLVRCDRLLVEQIVLCSSSEEERKVLAPTAGRARLNVKVSQVMSKGL